MTTLPRLILGALETAMWIAARPPVRWFVDLLTKVMS